jgi:hypothetical protein
MSVDQMSVDQMSVDQMSVDQMPVDQMSVAKCLWPNVCGQMSGYTTFVITMEWQ